MKKILLSLSLLLGLGVNAQLSCGSNFTDPSGTDSTYANDAYEVYTICPQNPGQTVRVDFSVFDLEAGWDYLTVYDSNTEGQNMIGAFDGNNLIGPFVAENPSGCLTFVFESDGSVVREGWEATVSCIAAITCLKPQNLNISSISHNQATLSWQANNGENSWIVEYGQAGFAIGSGMTIGVNTNPTTISGLIEQTDYDFYIRSICSVGDSSSYSIVSSGRTLAAPLFCNDEFMDSGRDTNDYANNEDVTYVICPTSSNQTVQLSFDYIALEQNYDFLTIYDDSLEMTNEIASYSGFSENIVLLAENATGCLTVTFTSDGSVVDSGWVASLACVAPVTCLRPTNLVVSNATASSLDLTFESTANQFEIEYGPQGFTQGSGQILTSSTLSLTVSPLDSGTTYDFYVRAICSANDLSSWSSVGSGTTNLIDLEPFICGNLFTDEGGEPFNYQNFTNDTIVLCPTSAGEAVQLEFSIFSLEDTYDFMYIYNGNTALDSNDFIGEYTGNNSPGTITSTDVTGCLTVVFTSDNIVADSGWVANISCVPAVNPNCDQVTNITFSNTTATSTQVSWTASANNLSWMIEYGPAGFTIGQGTQMSATQNSATLTGLNVNTAYSIYVYSTCTAGEEALTGPANFTTLNNVGLNEYKSSIFSIYPNPVSGTLKVVNGNTFNTKVSVIDLQGRRLFEGEMMNAMEIDFSKFTAGVYQIEFIQNNTRTIEKVIKK